MRHRLRRHTFYILRTLLFSFGVVFFLGYATLFKNVETVNYNPYAKWQDIQFIASQTQDSSVSTEVAKELSKTKSKKEKPLSSTTINSGGSKTTIVSEAVVTSEDIAKYNSFLGQSSSITNPNSVAFVDQTGKYAQMESVLKTYWQNRLLWTSGEIMQLRELDIVDCSSCEWLGLYQGSYTQDGSGKITNALGWISLNVAPIKNSPYLTDYLKLTLAHEYGHHYSLFYKWTKMQLPFGSRFPDEYYSARSLPKETTAADYSRGWGNCDAEIVAEDFAYLYSGYAIHAMAGTYGYPNASVRSWFTNLASTNPTEDSTAPTITITNPTEALTVAGTINLTANIGDNVKVDNAGFYIDDQLKSTITASPYSLSWDSHSIANGDHVFKVIASDGRQSATKTVNFKIDNSGSDVEPPTVSFVSPSSSPYQWDSGNLLISINASDNINIAKIELYINDTLVVTENNAPLRRNWQYFADAGTYILRAKAFDSSNNITEIQTTVVKP